MKIKQIRGNLLLGAIIVQTMRAQSYVALVQSFLVAAAANSQIKIWFPWTNFWIIALGLIAIYLVGGVIDYIIGTPAIIAFNNKQTCEHQNPVFDNILEMKKDIADIKEQLKEIRKCDILKG